MRLIFWLGFGLAIFLFFLIVELSRRKVLSRQSFSIALSLSIGLAVVSLLPGLLRSISGVLGLDRTYVFTSTIGILVLLVLNVYTLSKVGELRRRLSNLAQEVAIENAE